MAEKIDLKVALMGFFVDPVCVDAIQKAQRSGMSLEEIHEVLREAVEEIYRNSAKRKKIEADKNISGLKNQAGKRK